MSGPLAPIPTPALVTARFILRPLDRGDAAALFASFADPDTMRWWSRGPFASEEELADWLVPHSGWEEGRSWAVCRDGGAAEAGSAIGRLVAIDRGDGVSEIGYFVVREWQGQGVARETVAALVDHLFGAEGRRRVFADVDPDNAASNRLLESLGFTLEGRLREHWTTHIGRRDSLIWGLLASDWSPDDARGARR